MRSRSHPAPIVARLVRSCSRSSSRRRRRTRFRWTAPPSVRGVLSPIRVSGPSVRSDRSTSNRVERTVPRRPRASKSALRRSIGKAGTPGLVASGGQPLASLCASSGKHVPTALRSHAGAEAVFPLPGALLGLVGPLHRCVPVLVQRRASLEFPETHERLASRQPHAMAVSGSSRSARRFYRRLERGVKPPRPHDQGHGGSGPSAPAPVGACHQDSIAARERRLLHYRDPRGWTTQTPGSAPPRRE